MTPRPSPNPASRRQPGLLSLALLAGCGLGAAPAEPPLSAEALQTVATEPCAPRAALARAVDALFTAEGIGETRALIVVHEGRIVAERYAEGFGPETRFPGWSMAKTVTGVLIGMLVADGRLELDAPAPVAEWRRGGDPRAGISLRHLLQMRSGLEHEEKAEPAYTSPEVRMMFLDGRDDMAAWAAARPLEHAPGRVFDYSTPSTLILANIAVNVLAPGGSAQERQAAMARFLEDRLAAPLGMDSLTAEYDPSGTLVGGASIWADARDWAKFGEFLRRGGSAISAEVASPDWIAFMREGNPRAPDYGALIWLNRASGTEREMLFPDQGPASLFAAIGHLGQYILVSPDQRLTVVRLGKTDQENRDALVDRLADIVALYPSR